MLFKLPASLGIVVAVVATAVVHFASVVGVAVVTPRATEAAVTKTPRLIALSNITQLLSIDIESGVMKPLGPALPSYELKTQQLCGVDGTRGLFYFIGLNTTIDKPSVLALNVNNGEIEFEVPLPYEETALVGESQRIVVDEVTGDVIVAGFLANQV